jgi:hypothetical protein
MTSLTLDHITIWSRLDDFWKHIAHSPSRPETSDNLPEDAHSRQEFALEMLNKNSGAFQSEMDVQNMMRCFPGRF